MCPNIPSAEVKSVYRLLFIVWSAVQSKCQYAVFSIAARIRAAERTQAAGSEDRRRKRENRNINSALRFALAIAQQLPGLPRRQRTSRRRSRTPQGRQFFGSFSQNAIPLQIRRHFLYADNTPFAHWADAIDWLCSTGFFVGGIEASATGLRRALQFGAKLFTSVAVVTIYE